MTILIAGIILFLGIHMIRVIVPDFRAKMIAGMGETNWMVAYSVASLVSLAILAYGYSVARPEAVDVWYPPAGMAHLTVTLMLLASICLASGFLPAGHISTKTKHPFVLAVKIWAVAHLLANGDLASIVFFASFLAWGVVLRIVMKRRHRAGLSVHRAFVSGRYDIAAVVLGVVIWAAFILKLHELLFAVAPLPALSL